MAAINWPEALVFKREFVTPEVVRVVAASDVPVALVKVKVERVEEAGARKPFKRARVVLVACSLVESLVHGQEKVEAAGNEVRQSPESQKVLAASEVVVAFVVVELEAVKLWRVVEPVTRSVELIVEEAFETKPLFKASVVEVPISPVPSLVNGKAKDIDAR